MHIPVTFWYSWGYSDILEDIRIFLMIFCYSRYILLFSLYSVILVIFCYSHDILLFSWYSHAHIIYLSVSYEFLFNPLQIILLLTCSLWFNNFCPVVKFSYWKVNINQNLACDMFYSVYFVYLCMVRSLIHSLHFLYQHVLLLCKLPKNQDMTSL